MPQNPYQAPGASGAADGTNGASREELRKVARCQRGITSCILAYIISAVAFQILAPGIAKSILAFIVIGSLITGAVYAFMLAIKLFGTASGILLGLVTLVPCLNLVGLLIINSRATRVLRQNGIHVGIMGANPASV